MIFSELNIDGKFTICKKGKIIYTKKGNDFAQYISIRNANNKRTENLRIIYFDNNYIIYPVNL